MRDYKLIAGKSGQILRIVKGLYSLCNVVFFLTMFSSFLPPLFLHTHTRIVVKCVDCRVPETTFKKKQIKINKYLQNMTAGSEQNCFVL